MVRYPIHPVNAVLWCPAGQAARHHAIPCITTHTEDTYLDRQSCHCVCWLCPCPAAAAGIVHECILARDGLAGSTCPVSAGMIFLGHYQHRTPAGAAAAAQHDSHISTSSSNSTTAPLPGTAAAAAAAAAATASLAAQAAAAALGAMSQQGWLAASNNLTTASAVFLASHAGLLPPVLDYATAGAAEFIEFAPPSQEQLRQQQQQDWAKSAGSSGGSSSSHAAAVCPASGFAAPVLWFRWGHKLQGGVAVHA